jgi:EmrB/QacA subfamily drug resistance transporter
MSITPGSSSAVDGAQASASAGADRLARLALATVMIGAFMSLLDTTIVNVALPSIARGLAASHSALEWVVSGYALAFGLVLIPAGRLGDAIGRRPVYIAGLVAFLLASLGAGLSRTAGELVAARIVQGVAAGTYYTQINATIVDMFAGRQRGKAFGVLAAVIGLSTAVGPLAGGLLIAAAGPHSGWRWIFLVNLGIGVVALPAAARYLPAPGRSSVHRARQRADIAGLGLLTAALVAMLLPLIEGQTYGWPLWTYGCLAASVLLLAGMWRWESHIERAGRTPLISPRVVRQPAFATGAVFALAYFASFTSIFFSLAVTWQEGFGHGALASGLVVSPFAAGAIVTARKSSAIAQRLGRWTLILGCGTVATGLVCLLLVFHFSGAPSGWYLVGPLLVTGLGHGMIVAPNIDQVLKSVPPSDNGSASGVLNTAQRVGSAFGIAVVGTVLFGTLHPAGPGAPALAAAFGHSLQDTLAVNIGLIVVALALAAFGPRKAAAAPGQGAARSAATPVPAARS